MIKAYLTLFIAGLVGGLQAVIILDQDFNSTGAFGSSSLGRYNGQIGDPFRDAAAPGGITNDLLGNATGTSQFTQILTSGGISNSNYIASGDVRSRSTADITASTSFSSFFKVIDSANAPFGFGHGAGWSLASPDNVASPAAGSDDRFLVGFRYNTDGAGTENWRVAYGADLGANGSGNSPGGATISSTFDLTEGNWYQFSFDLAFNTATDTFSISDITLQNWGTDGATGGSAVPITYDSGWTGGSGSVAVSMGIGANFGTASDTDSYALFTSGAGTRGFGGYDHLSVAAVPEPSTWALLLGALTALAAFRPRRS